MRYFRLVAVVMLAIVCASAQAAVKPASLFTDNAILQRGMSVPVWGTADNGEKVTVRIQNQKVSAVAKDGKWMVRLKPLKEGGPYTMTISGSNKIELKNVLVGEVWLAGGQSNMVWSLRSSDGGEEAIKNATDPMLRYYQVPRTPAEKPVDFVNANWVESNPTTSPNFSGVAYFFARELRKDLGCPVGIISSNVGGTYVEAWTAPYALKMDPVYAEIAKKLAEKPGVDQNRPSVLYNGMIAPVVPYAMRGVIWYQGEANTQRAYYYHTAFSNLIRNWRQDWGQGDFPFLFVQLAPHVKNAFDPAFGESQWAELREAQLYTTRTVPNTAMAVIMDYGSAEEIHPIWKLPVGQRLELAARALAYGDKVVYKGPNLKSMTIKGDRAILEFSDTDGGLVAKGGDLKGFIMAGEDHQWHEARASIQGNRVIVSSPDVVKPVAVRYGWKNCPDVNLFNGAGLPASPFRTDDFPMTTMPKQ